MSQHDMNIANQGFPAFRSDLNDALAALVSTSSGATAPSTTFANQLWYDTANDKLKIRNEANSGWIEIVSINQSTGVLTTISGTVIDTPTITGAATFAAGTLGSPAITTTGDTNTGIYFPAADTIAFVEGGAEAMRISSDGNIAVTNTLAMGSSYLRNRIINGDMRIDQRNTGASGTANGYTVDRWNYYGSQASKFTWQRNAGGVNPPVGFTNYLGFTSSSSYSVIASDRFLVYQPIEGFNVSDLAWGSANAAQVTISFWVRSSLTGNFGASLQNSGSSRCYPFPFSISAANTWEKKTITIPGCTDGTWGTDNSVGVYIAFGLGTGSSAQGTANTWLTSLYDVPTGSVSVVGTSGATFYITGVQLEVGTVATPFERRQYEQELALCQRYYYRMKAATNYANFGIGRAYNSTGAGVNIELPVPMRAAPSGSTSGYGNFNSSGTSPTVTNLDPVNQYDTNYRRMTINVVSSFTSGQAVALNAENTTAAEMSWSAEL
jgi:hypothetical protein